MQLAFRYTMPNPFTMVAYTLTPPLFNMGIPQGSVLGPFSFRIDLLPLGQFLRRLGLLFNLYTDDTSRQS